MTQFEEIMVQRDSIVIKEVQDRMQQSHKLLDLQNVHIVEVWRQNLQQEIIKISHLAEKYNYIAFDTEFPGTIKYSQKFKEDEDDFQIVRDNVNVLKLIQIGFCLCNEKGEVPEKGLIWQFNFKFDLSYFLNFRTDSYHPDAILMLKDSGIDFDKLAIDGCEYQIFSEFIMSSGIILNEDIKWICFHGGYDFGYFLKLMTNQEISDIDGYFSKQLQIYFPIFHDIKYLINDIESIKNAGLGSLASELNGPQHQAGGDALTTSLVYFKLLEKQLNDNFKLETSYNILYGIGKGYKKKDFSKLNGNTSLQQEMDQMQDYNLMNIQNQYNMFNMMWPQMNNFYMQSHMPNQAQMYINQNEYVLQQQQNTNLKKKKK